jgi:hypothetical protein
MSVGENVQPKRYILQKIARGNKYMYNRKGYGEELCQR